MTTSEIAISRFTISRPLELRTFRLRLFLLTFISLKFPEVFRLTSRSCGVVVLGSLPRSFSGHSILMISAPKAPSQRVAHGPARTQLKSTTRIFSRARGRGIVLFSCVADTWSGQFLGHIETRMPGGLTIDPRGDLPALLQVETRCLKVQSRQHRPCTATPPSFSLGQGEDPAAEPVTPQMLGQKEPLHIQKAERRAAQQPTDDPLCVGIAGKDGERTPVPTPGLGLFVGAEPLGDYGALVVLRCI